MNNKSIMLKEHLKKHFKRIQTIKLKRHHYVLGGFGIAAIIAIASIFGFQNIATHAGSDDLDNSNQEEGLKINYEDLCDITNTTSVQKGGTGEIKINCLLGDCKIGEISNSILSGYNENISISSTGSINCLAACNENGQEDNCINNKEGKLKYDNVYTFTFTGISAGTSDIKLLANSVTNSGGNVNNEAKGEMITIGNNISCYIQISKTGINIGETGQAKIGCTGLEKSFESINTGDLEYNTDILTVNTENTSGHCLWEERYYVCPFIYEGTREGDSNFNLKKGSIFGNTQMVEGQIITVGNKASTQDTTFDCSIDINPLTNKVDGTGTIKITCKNTIKYSNLDLNSDVLELPDNNIIVVSNTGTHMSIEGGGQEFTFTYTGNTAGTGTVTLKEGSIVGSEGEYNNKKESKIITIENNTIKCKWEGQDIIIYKNETGNFKLICDNNNFNTGDIKNQIDITRPIVEITDLQKNALSQSAEQEEITYTVTFKGLNTGSTKLTISGTIGGQTITDNEELSPKITVEEQEPQNPIKCTITAEPYIVNLNSGGNIIVICDNINKNMSLTGGGLDYSGNITVSETSTRDDTNMTFTFTYTGIKPGDSHLKLQPNSISGAVQGNYGAEFETGIHVNTPDPIKCEISASPYTVDIDGTGNIIVTCKATKGINDTLSSTGLEYNDSIIDVQSIAYKELLGDTIAKYTFEYTGKAAPYTKLKLLSGVLYDNNLYTTNAEAEYESGIKVNDPIPDCNTGRDNDYFITPEFWALEPTDKNIICALYGENNKDTTAYTTGRQYDIDNANKCIEKMNQEGNVHRLKVSDWDDLLNNTGLESYNIYILTDYDLYHDQNNNASINLPYCSAIISSQTGGKDSTINNEIMIGSGFGIIDNISLKHQGDGIHIHSEHNTLNVVKSYGGKYGILVDGAYNMLNNIQAYANDQGIYLGKDKNSINNAQLYRNDIGLQVSSHNNIIYNTEIYQNLTGIMIEGKYNIFDSTNIYHNQSGNIEINETYLGQNTGISLNQYRKDEKIIDEITTSTGKTKKVLSGFDRVYLNSDLKTKYIFECEGGNIQERYTGNININEIGSGICGGDEYLGYFITGYATNQTDYTNFEIIETKPIFNRQGEEFTYKTYDYPDKMTNPRKQANEYNQGYYNNFNRIEYAKFYIGDRTRKYSYGVNINKQENTKLWNNQDGGLTNKKYFVGSNVTGYDISGSISKIYPKKIHYILTGYSTNSPITHYNIMTNLSNSFEPNTIIYSGYIGTSWQQFSTSWNNIYSGIDINSGVELYRKLGDTQTYHTVVQMYQDPDDNNYKSFFAEHAFAGLLTAQAPTLQIEPFNTCVYDETITMTGRRNGYEYKDNDNEIYDVTGFNFEDISVTGSGSKSGTNFTHTQAGIYTWQIQLDGGEVNVNINTNQIYDILDFNYNGAETKTYYRDIYGPDISTTGFNIPECTRKFINISGNDYCAGISGFSLQFDNNSIGGRQQSSIFLINKDIIGRTGGIKTGIIYAKDNFGNQSQKQITGYIIDIHPEVRTGTNHASPYNYDGELTGTITIENVITLLDAFEGECGTGDLNITNINCEGNATGELLDGNGISINPGNTPSGSEFICSIEIKDNENSATTGYIKFTTSQNYNGGDSGGGGITGSGCNWEEPTPNPISISQNASIKITCDEINNAEHANSQDLWNLITEYSGGNNIITTGNVTLTTGENQDSITYFYSGNSTGSVKLFSSLSDNYSSPINVIDGNDDNNKPHCSISGTTAVLLGHTGTITVNCSGLYGIVTTQLTSDDLSYDQNILLVGDSNTVDGTGNNKTFTFTFTGNNTGISQLALNTGVIFTIPNTSNNYTSGNDITVLMDSDILNGFYTCKRLVPQPQLLGVGWTGFMTLQCPNPSHPGIIELLQNSGNSITGTLIASGVSDFTLIYTGLTTGTTYFAISGTIGNVPITTNPYRSSGITLIGSDLSLSLDPSSGTYNNNITVNMHGSNAFWVKYIKTGSSNIDFDTCSQSSYTLDGSQGVFNGSTQINNTGLTYIFLCSSGTNSTSMISGSYFIDDKIGGGITGSGCDWEEPTPNPISISQNASVKITCDEINNAEHANSQDLWNLIIEYSGGNNIITTGNVTLTTGENQDSITYFYSGNSTGSVKLFSSLSDSYSSPINVIDGNDDNNKPHCSISGTTAVLLGHTGTITVNCTGLYGIVTTQLTSDDLSYDQNILLVGDSDTVDGTGNNKTFIFTFTGNNTGISQLALNTGVIFTIPNTSNNYTSGNDITVLMDSDILNGFYTCKRLVPQPQLLGVGWTGFMTLQCPNPSHHGIIELLQNSGNSITGTLIASGDSDFTLIYTGLTTGTSYFATSGTIGNVPITTNPYRSSGITVIGSDLSLSLDPSSGTYNNNITVNMHGSNAFWVKYIKTGSSNIDFDTCSQSSYTLDGSQGVFNGSTQINNTGLTYIFLCASGTNSTSMISGSYFIDTDEIIGDIETIYPEGENSCTSGSVTIRLQTGSSISGYPDTPFARNGTGESNWTGNNELIVTENGIGTGYVRNNAGTIQAFQYEITGIVKTGPTIPELIYPTENEIIITNIVNLSWSSSQATGCAQINGYQVNIYSGNIQIYTGTTSDTGNTTTLENGTYSRNVIATDTLGHKTSSNTGHFKVDDEGISIRATNSSNSWKTGAIDITMYATGTNLSGSKFITGRNINSFDSCRNNGEYYENESSLMWTWEGTGYLALCAYKQGGTKTGYWTGIYKLDMSYPTGEIITTYPSGHLTNGCTSGNVVLTLSGSDVNGLHTTPYKRDNEDWATNPTKTLTNNTHGTGYIRDVAGNITAIPYNITGISHSGPSISLSRPDSGAILTGYVNFNWGATATDPICQDISGGYNIVVYSGTVEQYTGNTNNTNIDTTLPNGNYTWKVSITDILGHTTESEIRPFSINNQAPTCDVYYTPASGHKTSGDVLAILTGCTPGTTGFNETGHTFTGNGTFEFTFENEFGNTGSTTAEVNRIDKDPPILLEVTPVPSPTTDNTPDYTFNSTESGTLIYGGSCSSQTRYANSGNNTITFRYLEPGKYSDCTIIAIDEVGNASEPLHVSEFIIETSGGGGNGIKKDYCPDGDYSDSYYDNTCDGPRDLCGVEESTYPDEMKLAYLYAYVHKITTVCPINDADLYGYLRRDHLAKMLSQYAINILGMEPEIGKLGCSSYNDISNSSEEMKYYMKTACELNLMGLESDGDTPMKSFYPNGLVTRAEFGTTLSRLIYGDKYNLASEAENTYPGAWYSRHLPALKKDGIMTQIDGDWPQHLELRGYVMLMLMRHGKARLENVETGYKNITNENILSMYNKNKELTCDIFYYDSYEKNGSGKLYVNEDKIKEEINTSTEGKSYTLFNNNTLYVWGDSIGTGKGVSVQHKSTAKKELQILLDDNNYSLRNCKSTIKNNNVFDTPSKITFVSMGDRFYIIGDYIGGLASKINN